MMRAVHLTALAAALAWRAGQGRAAALLAAALPYVGGALLMRGLGLLSLPRLACPRQPWVTGWTSTRCPGATSR